MLDETEDEYRRLLYVAMTRAADRLIVGGCMPGNMNTVRKFSWYDLIGKGLANSGLQVQEIETPDGTVKRYSRPEDAAAPTGAAAAPATAAPIELPAWLRMSAAAGAACRQSAAPLRSRRGRRPRRPNRRIASQLRARALQRGTLVHRLLQSLPDVAAERRRDAALKYLARNADGWTEAEREALADGVLALIDDPRFAAVFAAGSRAEVSIVGRLERPGRPPALVSGQIDRLVVTPERGPDRRFQDQPRPAGAAAEAPAAYVRQLALYRAVLAEALSPTAGPRRIALDRNP